MASLSLRASSTDPCSLPIKDTDVPPTASPSFLLKLSNDDELTFTFTFVSRQSTQTPSPGQSAADPASTIVDTQIQGLTYVYASNHREVENLVTREFQADPNLHKNSNVELVGDFTTGGSNAVSFTYTWKWKPPKIAEDRGGGWRTACSVWATIFVQGVWLLTGITVRRVRPARPQVAYLSQLLFLGSEYVPFCWALPFGR